MQASASERALLGALMTGTARLDEIALTGGDFSGTLERAIYTKMCSLADQGRGCSLVDMTDAMPEIDTQELVNMSMSACMRFEVDSAVKAVRGAGIRRGLLRHAQELLTASREADKEPTALVDDAIAALTALQGAGAQSDATNMQDAVLRTHEMLFDKPPERIMSGHRRYDAITGGMMARQLCVIGARPSVGKSAFALSIAVNAAKEGKRVLLVSLEMGVEEITMRMIANLSGTPMSAMQPGRVKEEETQQIVGSYGAASRLPIVIDTRSRTPAQVRHEAMHMRQNGGIDAVIIDYLQLMSSGRRAANRAEEVGQISRALKEMAMDMEIPVIALAQLNRDSEKINRKPTMSDLRESGNIEQDADKITLIYQMDRDNGEDEAAFVTACENKGWKPLFLSVEKNRSGRTGRIGCGFDGEHMRFYTREERREG